MLYKRINFIKLKKEKKPEQQSPTFEHSWGKKILKRKTQGFSIELISYVSLDNHLFVMCSREI
jgi:hypothetical protein